MATEAAVAITLKMLARAFSGGTVDDGTFEVYGAALASLSDEQLQLAATRVIQTHTGGFIPPPAVLLQAVAPARVAVDSTSIVRRIEKLATYNPNAGMIYPPVAVVRRELGEAIGYAYAAGGPRLFSDDETSRDISTREFSKALVEAESRPGAQLPVLGAGQPDPRVEQLVQSTTKQLGSGRVVTSD